MSSGKKLETVHTTSSQTMTGSEWLVRATKLSETLLVYTYSRRNSCLARIKLKNARQNNLWLINLTLINKNPNISERLKGKTSTFCNKLHNVYFVIAGKGNNT